jgi:hypothetical protein
VTMLRKPLIILAIALLLVLGTLTLLVPFLHEAFFLFAFYLMAMEFETGRALVKDGRRRWPFLSRLIERARGSRWAPRALGEFDDLTNPAK